MIYWPDEGERIVRKMTEQTEETKFLADLRQPGLTKSLDEMAAGSYEVVATKNTDVGAGPPYQKQIITILLCKDTKGHFITIQPATARTYVNESFTARFIKEQQNSPGR